MSAEGQVSQPVQMNKVKMPMTTCVLLHNDGHVERITDKQLEDYVTLVPSASIVWVDYTVRDFEKDLEKASTIMGFSLLPIPKLISGFYSSYEDSDTELGMMLPSVIVRNCEVTVRPLIVLIKGNLIMTVHDEEIVRLTKFFRYAPGFIKKQKERNLVDMTTMILERIIDENNDRNFEYLREIEKHGDDISRRLIDDDINKKIIAREIYEMKHVLITYLNVLWATKDVIDSLRYGDADLITDDEKLLGRIGILSDNIDRHIELSEQMSNVLSSGLEVMQSIYNNQLQTTNNRFALVTAYLTVLGTAFLVPNTIATIAGSGYLLEGLPMADHWWYPYLLIFSTLIATIVSLLWVWAVWNKKGNDNVVEKK